MIIKGKKKDLISLADNSIYLFTCQTYANPLIYSTSKLLTCYKYTTATLIKKSTKMTNCQLVLYQLSSRNKT